MLPTWRVIPLSSLPLLASSDYIAAMLRLTLQGHEIRVCLLKASKALRLNPSKTLRAIIGYLQFFFSIASSIPVLISAKRGRWSVRVEKLRVRRKKEPKKKFLGQSIPQNGSCSTVEPTERPALQHTRLESFPQVD